MGVPLLLADKRDLDVDGQCGSNSEHIHHYKEEEAYDLKLTAKPGKSMHLLGTTVILMDRVRCYWCSLYLRRVAFTVRLDSFLIPNNNGMPMMNVRMSQRADVYYFNCNKLNCLLNY